MFLVCVFWCLIYMLQIPFQDMNIWTTLWTLAHKRWKFVRKSLFTKKWAQTRVIVNQILISERIHVYYKITNKFALKSRQPGNGLRKYNCTGPGQVIGLSWRKYNMCRLITWRQLPSLSLEVEFGRGAPGTLVDCRTQLFYILIFICCVNIQN